MRLGEKIQLQSHRIEPETVDADVQPEFQNFLHLLEDERISVVEVGLLHEVLMQVELLPLFPKLPHGSPKSADPVCRGNRDSVVIKPYRIFPDVVIRIWFLSK